MGKKIAGQPTIRRLPSYLKIIQQAHDEGQFFISGTIIAGELELEPIQVRKDLSITGIVGKPRIGYPTGELLKAIRRFLHWDITRRAAVVGAGHLGQAIIGNPEFARHGLDIRAAFDTDPRKIGTRVKGVDVLSMERLEEKTRELALELAVLTVPSAAAQETAEAVAAAGIRGIWNFTNVKLKLPDSVSVQQENLASGYAVLSVRMGYHRPRGRS